MPYCGPIAIAIRDGASPSAVAVALADRLDVLARVGLERRELDPLLPAAVLDAGLREVVEDRLLEVRRVGVLRGLGLASDRLRAVAEGRASGAG